MSVSIIKDYRKIWVYFERILSLYQRMEGNFTDLHLRLVGLLEIKPVKVWSF
jgi:hypothetical protein